MSGRRDSLSPPERDNTNDPGAHELGKHFHVTPQALDLSSLGDCSDLYHTDSESDDHFSDAQSAPRSPVASPIPKLRVEKVSDEPSYGEVPGTEAYRMREGDAAPDEIAIVVGENKIEDEDQGEDIKSPSTPGGYPIPKMVVEESPGNTETQSHPEKKYKADTPADLVIKPSEEQEASETEGTGTKA